MKEMLLILFFFCSLMSFGQTILETKDNLLPFDNGLLNDKKTELSIPYQFQTPTLSNSYENRNFKLIDIINKNQTINFPAINNKTFLPNIKFDGNLYNRYYINSRNWINTSRIQNNYIGLGGLTTVSANYNWRIGTFSIITGGLYASKFNVYNNFRNDAGVNGNIKFVLSDRISMNLFGQYSVNGINNAIIPLMSTLYPQSFYGGSFEFKVNDKWGLMVGAENEFDVMTRKWVTKPFVMPLFYQK
ncbi:MAG TPA: hypothetical protein VIK55_06360 [Paludibacter sp.]